MSDYEFDFGGSAGPFLRWHPRATELGDIAAGQWSLRSPGGERTRVESMTRAFVFDVPSPTDRVGAFRRCARCRTRARVG